MKLVLTTGSAVPAVARQLGVDEAILGRWVITLNAHDDSGETDASESKSAVLRRPPSVSPAGSFSMRNEHRTA